ncbi:MAG: dolichyl-phosphate beta-glucosyltransferase [Kiritimatiellia bacterium]
MKLSIVVPAYNEEKRIRPMLDAYLAFFTEHYGSDFELVVVVNGSTDGTAAVVQEYAARLPQVRCIVEPAKIGKGGAVKLGFESARGEIVGFADADGSTPPDAFQALADQMEPGVDAVIASRWFKESEVYPRQTVSRQIASRIFNGFVRLMLGLKIRDTQCGAKVFKKEALDHVVPSLGITRWAFDVDLLFQLQRAGYSIREAPTKWHDVGGSQIRIFRSSVQMFFAVTRLRLYYSPLRWIVKLYESTLGQIIKLKV